MIRATTQAAKNWLMAKGERLAAAICLGAVVFGTLSLRHGAPAPDGHSSWREALTLQTERLKNRVGDAGPADEVELPAWAGLQWTPLAPRFAGTSWFAVDRRASSGPAAEASSAGAGEQVALEILLGEPPVREEERAASAAGASTALAGPAAGSGHTVGSGHAVGSAHALGSKRAGGSGRGGERPAAESAKTSAWPGKDEHPSAALGSPFRAFSAEIKPSNAAGAGIPVKQPGSAPGAAPNKGQMPGPGPGAPPGWGQAPASLPLPEMDRSGSFLSEQDLDWLRSHPQKLPVLFLRYEKALVHQLGKEFTGLTREGYAAAFCCLVSYQLRPYRETDDPAGRPLSLDLSALIATPKLVCNEYGHLTGHLFATFPAAFRAKAALHLIGWDKGPFGNHAQVFVRNVGVPLLLDPTIGVVARADLEGLRAGQPVPDAEIRRSVHQHRYGQRLDEQMNAFADRVTAALRDGTYPACELLYNERLAKPAGKQ